MRDFASLLHINLSDSEGRNLQTLEFQSPKNGNNLSCIKANRSAGCFLTVNRKSVSGCLKATTSCQSLFHDDSAICLPKRTAFTDNAVTLDAFTPQYATGRQGRMHKIWPGGIRREAWGKVCRLRFGGCGKLNPACVSNSPDLTGNSLALPLPPEAPFR